ncbi:MAG: branched-chain amino acid ABC transporter permease [Alphaproteobacteria bacterium]|nr:branched-chain amino acid ABC transporter permease [Alphaproteobacteria bacterium]
MEKSEAPVIRASTPKAKHVEAAGLACLFGLFALLPLAIHLGVDPFYLVIATRIMIFGIAALSLDLILGFGAMVSFGHAAFIGIGAYAAAIAAAHGVTDLLVQFLFAMAAAAAFGLVTGVISLRTKGVYFIMITLAFGQMAYFLMVSLSAYGGDDGLTLKARSTLFGQPWLESDVFFYYLVLVLLLTCFLFARAAVGARFGRVLRGVRDNALRMQAIGFDPLPFQLTAYVLAGVLAALAGVLLANQAEFVSPAYMTWQRSGELIMMVVVGGMGTLTGGILGAAAFLLLEEVLSAFSQHWKLGLGVILVLIVLYGKGGIHGILVNMHGMIVNIRGMLVSLAGMLAALTGGGRR